MINVLHFDHDYYFSYRLRNKLAKSFTNSGVYYYDFTANHRGDFETNQTKLEKMLIEKDALLIHPGVNGQRRVLDYLKIFPKLHILFVVPQILEYKSEDKKLVMFNYEDTERIVNFVKQIKIN